MKLPLARLIAGATLVAFGPVGCSSADESRVEPRSSGPETSAPSLGGTAETESVRIQRFLDARYTASDVRHSFRTSLGQDIDCIDFFAQPSVRALAARGTPITALPKPPADPAGLEPRSRAPEPDMRASFDGQLDEESHARLCPEGTVPQVRVTPEHIRRAGGVDSFRAALHGKVAVRPAPPADSYVDCSGADTAGYAHVQGWLNTSTAPIASGSSFMAIYGPTIPTAADTSSPTFSDHSLAQTWTTGYAASGLQTVEAGWNVDRVLYPGDTHTPHLFIYSTTDGYVKTGCYNDWASPGASTCVPWVQTSRLYTPGMALPPSTVNPSASHGSPKLPRELYLRTVIAADGNWWVQAQVSGDALDYMGFYAGSAFTAPMTYFSIGGEVFDETEAFSDATLEMGSGLPASEGAGLAAYHRDYSALVAGADGGSPFEVSSASVCSTRPKSYAYSSTPSSLATGKGAWQRHFFYGRAPTTTSKGPTPDGSVPPDASE